MTKCLNLDNTYYIGGTKGSFPRRKKTGWKQQPARTSTLLRVKGSFIMTQKLPKSKRKAVGIRIKPKEGLYINYQLRLRGITHQNLADQLGLKRESVTKIITGARHSTRVEDTLYQTLGYPSFSAMISDCRKQGGIA